MKRYYQSIGLFIIVALVWGGCAYKDQANEKAKQQMQDSHKIAKEYPLILKGKLEKVIAEKGPAGSIEDCSAITQEIADQLYSEYPDLLHVRRISLKTRNTEKHTPTEEEKGYLIELEKEWATDPSFMMNTEQTSTESPSGKVSVYYFPFGIDDPTCLTCHGMPDQIQPDIKDALAKYYPQDQATGYQLGDFRGALAITWKK